MLVTAPGEAVNQLTTVRYANPPGAGCSQMHGLVMKRAIEQETLQTPVETGAVREFRVHHEERPGAWSCASAPNGCQCTRGMIRI